MSAANLLASFIFGTMPLGATPEKPLITVEQAYDIAAYVNSVLPRRHDPKRNTHYPNPLFRPESFHK